MCRNQLTVLIPTYNRKNGLSNQLMNLSKQTRKDFKIVILDNASPYDIDELVRQFPSEIVDKTTVIKRKYNVGLNANISELFTWCDTKWGWTLSDDDNIFDDSIEKIYDNIERFPDAGCLHFSILKNLPLGEKGIIPINNLNEFIEFYERRDSSNSSWHGDLIFLSNKVFNIEKVSDYFGDECHYSYSYLPGTIIQLKALEECTRQIIIDDKISEKLSVQNLSNGVSWNYYKAYLACRTFLDIPFNISPKQHNRLMRIILFDIRDLIYTSFVLNDVDDIPVDYRFWNHLYYDAYRYILPKDQKILLWVIAKVSKMKKGYSILKWIVESIYKVKA